MTWKDLFFGFDGRISRRQWWTAMIPLLLTNALVSFVANPMSWFSGMIAMRGPNLAETLFNIALLIPETAIMVKRFNDRDWPQWLPYGYAAVFLFYIVLNHNRMILAGHAPTMFEFAVVSSLVSIMFLVVIDNGFLRGTDGPNRYGQDPLAKNASASHASKSSHGPT